MALCSQIGVSVDQAPHQSSLVTLVKGMVPPEALDLKPSMMPSSVNNSEEPQEETQSKPETLTGQTAEASSTVYCQLPSLAAGSIFQSAMPQCPKIWGGSANFMLIALIMLVLLRLWGKISLAAVVVILLSVWLLLLLLLLLLLVLVLLHPLVLALASSVAVVSVAVSCWLLAVTRRRCWCCCCC